MTGSIALSDEELAEVRCVLSAHLPAGVNVSVFGSRAVGRAGPEPKPWSDLDLALEGTGPLPLALLAELAEAFDESALPCKVDLVDRASLNEAFAAIIARTGVPLDLTGPG